MDKWTLRRAHPGDEAGIKACIDAAYAVFATRIADLPDVSAGIVEDIANHLVFVAETSDGVAGALVLMAQADHGVLANVAVHPNSGGMGIGRALIAHAEAECIKLGLSELRLNTHIAMPENVKLYEKLGWRQTGQSASKVAMVKMLTAERHSAVMPSNKGVEM